VADIDAIVALGGRPMAVLTSITIQSSRGVGRVSAEPPRLITAQTEELFRGGPEDLPRAVKLGMLAEPAIARALGKVFERWLGRRPLVIDPVFKASSGAVLFEGQPRDYAALFERARVVTPNLEEAAHLLGEPIGQLSTERAEAARELSRLLRCAVVLKGGHATRDADDLVADEGKVHVLSARRLSRGRRGTGCRFASALATRLAMGDDVLAAARAAKGHVRAYLMG
jgi:hydroxymethylpyrimidine/phosphomethylpyrimidine kinase